MDVDAFVMKTKGGTKAGGLEGGLNEIVRNEGDGLGTWSGERSGIGWRDCSGSECGLCQ